MPLTILRDVDATLVLKKNVCNAFPRNRLLFHTCL